MSACPRVCASLFAILGFVAVTPGAVQAHPLHTTLTEITEDRVAGTTRATIRVFADDFGTAVRKTTGTRAVQGTPAWETASRAYVAHAFTITDATGRALPLTSCGTRGTGGLLWICVEVAARGGAESLRLRDAMLCELFADQVNVVQGTVAGARRSVLFTRGDAPKSLR